MKFVSIFKLDPLRLAAKSTDEQEMLAMGALIKEMMDAGVLIDTGGVLPTGIAMRMQRRDDGNFTMTDGPFAESKEVVGGFAVLNVSSKDEAIACTRRFLDIAGPAVCELHEVSETPAPGP